MSKLAPRALACTRHCYARACAINAALLAAIPLTGAAQVDGSRSYTSTRCYSPAFTVCWLLVARVLFSRATSRLFTPMFFPTPPLFRALPLLTYLVSGQRIDLIYMSSEAALDGRCHWMSICKVHCHSNAPSIASWPCHHVERCRSDCSLLSSRLTYLPHVRSTG